MKIEEKINTIKRRFRGGDGRKRERGEMFYEIRAPVYLNESETCRLCLNAHCVTMISLFHQPYCLILMPCVKDKEKNNYYHEKEVLKLWIFSFEYAALSRKQVMHDFSAQMIQRLKEKKMFLTT